MRGSWAVIHRVNLIKPYNSDWTIPIIISRLAEQQYSAATWRMQL